MFKSIFPTSIRQSGQVSVLFALLMPIFILFLGLVLDLGWYYLNVSRLQNAADAAAVAGAHKLLTDKTNFADYKNVALVGKYPAKVSNQYETFDESALKTISEVQSNAKKYAGKNLSGNENILVNSWTKNKVNVEAPTLYAKGDNLYFVVQLKDTIRHFFLPGWFDDMDAPVTAVAMISKTAIAAARDNTHPEIFTVPLVTGNQSDFNLPTMPAMPDNPRERESDSGILASSFKNSHVIIHNWEVQNYYRQPSNNKVDPATGLTLYAERFNGSEVYSKAWNHFQDFYNWYAAGDLYRTQTITILDDVLFNTDNNGEDTIYEYGRTSSVAATSASINTDKKSSAYNPKVNARKTYKAGITETGDVGLPYTQERLDSINIDFRPEVMVKGKWLSEDWDVSLGYDSNLMSYSNSNNNYKDSWDNYSTLRSAIQNLRIHTSINFDGVYPVRPGKAAPDILYVRIESEPMLHEPDIINDDLKNSLDYSTKITHGEKDENGATISKPGVVVFNSVNQIIINANASNADTDCRPYVIYYDGPETNDVYSSYKNDANVFHRESKPVILNLNKPFRAILCAPKSPVVIIGDYKDYFQGFVAAKEYWRLKNENDFVLGENTTDVSELRLFGLRTYYAKDDTNNVKTPYYKIIDENGIEMFVDRRGDIQFAKISNSSAPAMYGKYDNFGIKQLEDYDGETSFNENVFNNSAYNMFFVK